MPILGFGVFQIADLEACEKCVLDAIQVGYRSIDTAVSYGNEMAVGNAIRSCDVAREELFITTKVWIQTNGYENTMDSFKKSLQRLQLDYIDLYLIHQPMGDVYGTWRAMQELYKSGLIKAIGVCNFQPDRIVDLIQHHEIIPAVNQVETHPFHQQFELQQFLQNEQIQMESWAPFAEGRNHLFQNEILASIGHKYGKSIAQVVLRWLIQRKVVVIPKTIRKEKMKENFEVFDFELNETDMDLMKSLDLKTSSFFDHRDPAMVKWLGERKFI